VPMIGLVQASTQAMADRFAYFPLIGLFVAATWMGAEALLGAPRRLAPILATAVVLTCVVGTWRQLGHWRNSVTLFSHALAVTTNNPVAHNNLGSALQEMGRLEEAVQHHREAIRLKPKAPQAYNNLGNVLDELGRFDEAVNAYQQALALRPGVALVHNNLAITLAGQRRYDEARHHLLRAMELKPRDAHPHYLMGTVHLRQGDAPAAVTAFRAALQLDSAHARTLTLLSRLLAANESDAIRSGPEAVRFAEQAVAVTGGERLEPVEALAMAYAETGRFEEAMRLQSEALEQAKQAGAPERDVEEAAKRLTIYQARRPYRESATNLLSHPHQTSSR
jgi:protein O-mannosyl-transferase